ncbi:MAG: Autotransporter beta domain-containing protein [Bacteroidetes bacterium OLB12]|nr:MAG: Autotransporter beta domain-containing protein [Bacteroidetes bacterium OLB12]
MYAILAMMFIAPAAWAQTTQGSKSIGGGFEYYSNKQENIYGNYDYESSSFEIMPQVGYFIIDNLEVGVLLNYTSGKSGYTQLDPTKNSSFSVGPFARYYKFTSNERFAFTGTFSVSFGSGKTTYPSSSESKTGNMGVFISPGFTYFLSEKWGLDFQLQGIGFTSYDPNKDVDDDNSKTITFGVSSFTPSIGFRFFIN